MLSVVTVRMPPDHIQRVKGQCSHIVTFVENSSRVGKISKNEAVHTSRDAEVISNHFISLGLKYDKIISQNRLQNVQSRAARLRTKGYIYMYKAFVDFKF